MSVTTETAWVQWSETGDSTTWTDDPEIRKRTLRAAGARRLMPGWLATSAEKYPEFVGSWAGQVAAGDEYYVDGSMTDTEGSPRVFCVPRREVPAVHWVCVTDMFVKFLADVEKQRVAEAARECEKLAGAWQEAEAWGG